MNSRTIGLTLVFLMGALLIQTTLLARLEWFSPELVLTILLVVALGPIRRVPMLVIAFGSGLIIDLLGSLVIGMRALIYTVVIYLALRVRDRLDIGLIGMAVTVAGASLLFLALFFVVGTLFDQGTVISSDIGRRAIVVPLLDAAIAAAIYGPLQNLVTTETIT
ncbi:MAG: rod shape-determining protein MreD [Acidimicrobiia bacterium]|nr:rod shape-determining protein MreD [Acidimicrobiia bacterium]